MLAKTKIFAGMLKALCAHTAKISQDWLKTNMENHWSEESWLPSSPNCNPLDPSMWSVFEREVNKQPHITLATLRVKILEVMADMDRKVVIRSYKKVLSRIKAVVDASGDFIK